LNIRKRKKQHDSTPPTKARWFDDNDWLDEIDDNLIKGTLVPSVPETALSVQSFFERLDGDEPPSG
jgi:hypothetical protein